MGLLGGLLFFLGLPLMIGYFLGEQKNNSWRNLGMVMLFVGLLIMILPG